MLLLKRKFLNKTINYLCLLIFFLSFPACTKKVVYKPHQEKVTTGRHSINLQSSTLVIKKLMSQHDKWKGTRYREGGLSKKGVDCSGFVYITYQSVLGIQLPRTSDKQATVGVKISRNNLQAGDLIFFKTGFFTRHVGIFLQNSDFLHASTSKGVTISSLKNNYWKSRYIFSRRITPNL